LLGATVDDIAQQFDRVYDGATDDRQWGAAGSAASSKAKLLGHMRDMSARALGDELAVTTIQLRPNRYSRNQFA